MFQSLLDSNCAKVFEFALSNKNLSIKKILTLVSATMVTFIFHRHREDRKAA